MKSGALVLAILTSFGSAAWADGDSFTLEAPAALRETGLMGYILPRFALKTSIRPNLVETDGAAAFGAEGTPVFRQDDTIWALTIDGSPAQMRFLDWLTSDVGKRTVESFADVAFSADVSPKAVVAAEVFEGDAAAGERLALAHCGRCHVVSEKNRMDAIGSTPSFAVLRTFSDWSDRFQAFFALKPHGAFTQIEGVTEPFDPARPSPIVPVEMTLDEVDAIVAFVQHVSPADLGAPVQSR
ncbi:c-type cytochrome [Litoreibacter roseus]|uniref:Cytochrome c domain-containing protein n=1 Tax=Litoreibacter roseus TaxID=2601869 RepID=A0A6N6JAF2_9RHOB|nr:cytochrome c [Litoreibacter roseus]GFE63014.1 hypothetical protein KIN_00880 [Litoreibacter roseus]